MTNDQTPITNELPMTNVQLGIGHLLGFGNWDLEINIQFEE
jgi:hypothetical protein